MSGPVYVIGHRNPDTDAICSAIGYASFLRESKQIDARPACCGEISVRTAWVLKQAGLEPPKLLLDVRPTAASIARRQVVTATPEATLLEVNRRMLEKDFRSIPVVDDEGRLVGMPSLAEMAELLMPPKPGEDNLHRQVRTSLANVVHALDGEKAGEAESSRQVEELILVVAASSEATTRARATQFDPRKVILLVGDRPEIHRLALDMGVRCLVITGGFEMTQEMEAEAKRKRVAIVLTNHDSASSAQLIRFSRPIADALRPGLISFRESTPLVEVLPMAQQSHQPLFPVIDDDSGLLMGVFSKSDLIDVPRVKLVLVDHNEFAQAVGGADEAEILEVIDHHRLSGNLRTKEPIRFINEPVGSTSTIVALMYRMRAMTPDRAVALCLSAGLISDTLNLTSPTTTNTDRDILGWLCGIAGIDSEQFVKDFFAAGSMLKELAPAAAIESDRKEFTENGWRISISQIEELGLGEFWKREEALEAALKAVCEARKLHFACLMVTDITEHNSVLLTVGDERLTGAIDYPKKARHLFHMPGVVSRKKQLFPYLGRLMSKLAAPVA
ncbi:MAG: putative manganese-dependent inorganic diphosphatase [Verrucomicrobiaceae bacterium]|nr:putative manganese-dependent inorganic diphosphatase [Verrucomicrobiaceae bacterium]